MISPINKSSLTFIELLLVVVIISILVTLSIPQFRKTFDNLELESFVKDIYYLSRYLQASSISQAKIHCLNINLQEAKLWANYKEENELKQIEGKLGKIFAAPPGIIISLDPADKTSVYFYPDGNIDKITITFENKYKKQVSLVTQGVTGDIKIQ